MLRTLFRATLIGLLFCAPAAAADAVSSAAAVARAIGAFADAAAAQVPVAEAALRDTRAATAQAESAKDRALQATIDADQAKQRADKNNAAAQASAEEAKRMRGEAELAARGGLCAKAKVAAAAAERAAVAAEKAAEAIGPEIPATATFAAAADRAKADALAAKGRANVAANSAAAAYAASDKAAAAGSKALAQAYGKGMTVSEIGKSPGDGDVTVSDANYGLFQDGVAAAQRGNSAASTVNELRQKASISFNEADSATKTAYGLANHIRTIQGQLIEAKNTALRIARQARADADAAAKAVAACVPPTAGQASSPPPGATDTRSYPGFTHRQTDCASCRALAAELNREIDRYNALENTDRGKDDAFARVRALADQLSECERRCPADDRAGMPQPKPGMEGPTMPGMAQPKPGMDKPAMPGPGVPGGGTGAKPPPAAILTS